MKPSSGASPEPIAVVGLACRMPGDVRSPADLWELILSKGIANKAKVPESRFNIDAYLHASNDRPGSFNIPGGYFLEGDPEAFDPGLFNISPVEAMWMDPQQKKLLEVVYEAFESSGTTLSEMAGRKTGCFVGSFTSDFLQSSLKDPDFTHPYLATGADPGLISNRVSYVFDLNGPSLTVNTACSSSLYSLDLACKSILAGECEDAIVGGTNIILTANQQMNTARMGTLSPTNQCHSFDEAADGYGRAEGVGALYLRPLSVAMRNGDPIRAVIRGTAVSSNGKAKDGLFHPSVEGQMETIRLAYQAAGLTPEHTAYVEAHGTGTPVGDPIEVEAISRAMALNRPAGSPVLIGSVKPNVGHSEAASSMGTLIKTILALESGFMAPTAGINRPNLAIPWKDSNVQVVTKLTPFPSSLPVRRIGVNAFGYGGTNAHAVLESVDSVAPGYCRHSARKQASHHVNGTNGTKGVIKTKSGMARPQLLLFSAHDKLTLQNNLADYERSCSQFDPTDLAYTLGHRRSKLSHRTFAVVDPKGGSLETEFQAASTNILAETGKAISAALVFTGQGAQWPQMGADLLKMFPATLQTIRRLDQYLSRIAEPPSWSIETVLQDPKYSKVINHPEYSQPLCTAVQIALVDLLAYWGVEYAATVGHSSGEIAAAYAAGQICAESAMTAAFYRGRAVAPLESDGAMLAVGLSADEAFKYIQQAGCQEQAIVACHNSPKSVTLSGDRSAIDQIHAALEGNKIFARKLKTNGRAYHSFHMEEVAATYEEYLQSSEHPSLKCITRPRVPMFSATRPQQIYDQTDQVKPSYWVDNLRRPVMFRQAVQLMITEMADVNTLIEVGPHTALSGPLRDICKAMNKPSLEYLPTLSRGKDDGEQMLSLAGNLWARDSSLDLVKVLSVESLSDDGTIETKSTKLLVDLPPYHWSYTRKYSPESRLIKEGRKEIGSRHDLLGRRVVGPSPLEPIWRNVLRQKDLPWLSHHRLAGEVLLPATGYLALAVEAITQINEQSDSPLVIQSYTVRDMAIPAATAIPDDESGTETLFRLSPVGGSNNQIPNGTSSQWYDFTVSRCSYGSWSETARGKIAINARMRDSTARSPPIQPGTHGELSWPAWVEKLNRIGFELGPSFQRVAGVRTENDTHVVHGGIELSQVCGSMTSESRYVLHPGVLDAYSQPLYASVYQGRLEDLRCPVIPTHVEEFTMFVPSAEQLREGGSVRWHTPQMGNRAYVSNGSLVGQDGSLLVETTGLRLLKYEAAIPPELRGPQQQDLYLQLEWKIDANYLNWAIAANKITEKQSLGTAVDLLVHQDARRRVLCLDVALIPEILEVCPETSMVVITENAEVQNDARSRYSDFKTVEILLKDENSTEGNGEPEKRYDLVIASQSRNKQQLDFARQSMANDGLLLLSVDSGETDGFLHAMNSTGLAQTNIRLPGEIAVMRATDESPETTRVNGVVNGTSPTRHITVLYRDAPSPMLSAFTERLSQDDWHVSSCPIHQSLSLKDISDGPAILLADLEGPLLAYLNEAQLEALKYLTDNVSHMTWVTCGGLLTGNRPEFAMNQGAARVIRNEKASLDLVTVDFDVETTAVERVADLVADIADRQHTNGRNGETEYFVKSGVAYVGRLKPQRDLSKEFVSDSGDTSTVRQSESPALRARLEHKGLVFRRDEERQEVPLAANEVEVHVAAVGLTTDDFSDDSNFLSRHIAGTITRAGSEVQHIVPRTDVFGFALSSLETFQRTPSSLVRPLPSGCSVSQGASLSSAFPAAIYALEELMRIEAGETVVVVDGLGAVAMAALQLCRVHKVKSFLITSSRATKQTLVENGILSPSQIIRTHENLNLSGAIKEATSGNGIDALLVPETVEESTLVACHQHMASLGRIASIGSSLGKPSALHNIPASQRGLSCFSLNMTEIVMKRPSAMSRVLERVTQLFEGKQIELLGERTTVRPSQSDKFLQKIPSDLGSGDMILAYDQEAVFQVEPSRRPLRLRRDATYLMVGCLGGIGQLLALWMAERGARHFAFLSRSGTENNAGAVETVLKLEDQGAHVTILRADVTDYEALAREVARVDTAAFPIRGVVNAATLLLDAVFANMTLDLWHGVAGAKVQGSLNLHRLLSAEPLDFFVMTSSIASAIGSTAQSNYSAANAVLDSLAVHRRSRGRAAVSVILPAVFGVGAMTKSPELVESVKFKGMYGIDKDEMLAVFDIALRPQHELPAGLDHIGMGMQPRRFAKSLEAVDAQMRWEDPRLNWFKFALDKENDLDSNNGGGKGGQSKGLDITTRVRQASSREVAVDELAAYIGKRLATLLMIDIEVLQSSNKSIAGHGLDSMIGVELRNWLYREFGVELPFQQLLASSLTVEGLAEIMYEEVKS